MSRNIVADSVSSLMLDNQKVGQIREEETPSSSALLHPSPSSVQNQNSIDRTTDDNNNTNSQDQRILPSQDTTVNKRLSDLPKTIPPSTMDVSNLTSLQCNEAEVFPKIPVTRSNDLEQLEKQQLENRIKQIIDQNAAIVETLDPLWSKKYMNSRHHSTSSIPTRDHLNGQESVQTFLTTSDGASPTKRRYSEVVSGTSSFRSRLQSALMGQSSTETSPSSSSSSSSLLSSPSPFPLNGRKLSNGTFESVIKNGRQVAADQLNLSSMGSTDSPSLVRDLLTSKVSLPVKRPPSNSDSRDPPDNPERSVIKDLLLKAREQQLRQSSPPVTSLDMKHRQYLPLQQLTSSAGMPVLDMVPTVEEGNFNSSLFYACSICQIVFRSRENLEVHRIHYCKGNPRIDRRVGVIHNFSESPFFSRQPPTSYMDVVHRKISVVDPNCPSVLQRRLIEGKSEVDHDSSGGLGTILKNTLEGAKKRKMSEPVFPSNRYPSSAFVSPPRPVCEGTIPRPIATRKVSVVQVPTRPLQPLDEDSFTKQVSAMLERTREKQPLITLSTRPVTSVSPVYVPFSGQSTIHNESASKNEAKVSFEVLPDYCPHISLPKTRITLKGPLVFPVLERIISEDRETIEFQVKDPTEVVANSVFDVNVSPPQNPAETSQPATGIDGQENDKQVSIVQQVATDVSVMGRGDSSPSPQEESPQCQDKETTSSALLRPSTLDIGKSHRKQSFVTSNIVSPDTPRPRKPVSQMYLNGQAYTYIGLKVSTRSTFCSIYRPQPMFVTQETQPKLSMYCNWQSNPSKDPLFEEVTPKGVLASYNSFQKGIEWTEFPTFFVISKGKSDTLLSSSKSMDRKMSTISSPSLVLSEDTSRKISNCEDVLAGSPGDMALRKISEDRTSSTSFDSEGDPNQPKRVKIFEGGFKSNEDYTYVRGRGRGKYVCEECGIRCRKPSMLKKHIRTHTDLRPYSCRHCCFAFKTKGNLTKHMKSKAHHKKCVELGIVPVPTTIDDSQIDSDALAKQEALERSYNGGNLLSDDDDNEVDDDDDEDNESEDEGVPISLIGYGNNNNNCYNGSNGSSFAAQSSSPDKTRKISLDFHNHNHHHQLHHDIGAASRRTSVVVNKNEEQEVAQSLLSLSGSWTESHKSPKGLKVTPTEDAKRKVSILETTLTPGAWDPRLYMSRPRSFSFNDVPLQATNLRSFANMTREQPLRPLPNSIGKGEEATLPPQVVPEIPAERPRRETAASPDRLMIAMDADHVTSDDDESERDIEKESSKQTSWRRPPSTLKEAVSEDEPMDLSKRSADPGPSAQDVEDGEDEDSFEEPHVPRQDFMPIPLASGAEDGEGKSTCTICNTTFHKHGQLRLHLMTHYFERPHRCETCLISFRSVGHLKKHQRSVSHYNKVNLNRTFGPPSNDNPRPFKCSDCQISFRIHGHLSKHLRSKLHIMKLECLNKLPFGMFAELERSGVNLTEIDTTDSLQSLISLQSLCRRMSSQSGSSLDISTVKFIDPSTVSGDDDDIRIEESPNKRVKMEGDHYHHLPSIEENLRERSISFSGTPAVPIVSSLPERRVTVFSAEPGDITRRVQEEMFSRPTPSTQPSIATRSNTCDKCGQIFKSVKFLHIHLYESHPPEPSPSETDNPLPSTATVPSYKCNICGLVRDSLSQLQQHLLTHPSHRPFVCTDCDAGFQTPAQLAAHLPTHSILQVR